MAIFKFRDLCCPVHSVKLVQLDKQINTAWVSENTLKQDDCWVLEIHIEITSTVPHFRKFHYDTEKECISDYRYLIEELEDKGWGNGNI